MTKEVIIDGVDVTGCEYYKGKCMEYTYYCQIGCKECTDIGIKLCHYKQTERFKAKIDRLEQENEKLLHTLQEIKEIAEEWKNTPWFCFNCGNNMDKKLQDIIDLITKAEEE